MINENMIIALADDDADDREIFMKAANSLEIGVRTLEFENGPQLVEFLQNTDSSLPEVIFLDLNNPVMDGVECLQIIRGMERCSDIMIAIYTTSARRKDVDGTFVLGADLYIQKPNSLGELQKCITKVLQTSSQYPKRELSRDEFFLSI